jgi:hypothetical protein
MPAPPPDRHAWRASVKSTIDKDGPVPRLTILIPCVGGAAEFDATLVSVLQHRPDDCEVLLVHTQPYDDPYDLRDEVQFLHAGRDGRLAELLNEGLAAASGEIVHILGCGMETIEGWTEPALAHFDQADIAAVSPMIVDSSGESLVAAGIRWTLGGWRRVMASQRLMLAGAGRQRAAILGPTLAAGFFRRNVLQALGGLDASLDDRHVDVDLALAIASLNLLTVCEPACRVKSTIDQQSQRPRTFAHGKSAERLFWRHAETRGKMASLLMHPLVLLNDVGVAGSGLGVLSAGLGRFVALCELGSVARHDQRLVTARQRLAEAAEQRATIRLPAKRALKAADPINPQRRAA